MLFRRISPADALKTYIECYWIIENEDRTVICQKIIPDGFTEIIFHYKDPFRIQLNGVWQMQSKYLWAGQIQRHFFIENTGKVGIVGIKFKPAALAYFFGVAMHPFVDTVIDLGTVIGTEMQAIENTIASSSDHEAWVSFLDEFFLRKIQQLPTKINPIDIAIELIFSQKGMVSVKELTHTLGISERTIERLFRHYVGVSPKLYARIIRFSNIFSLIEQHNSTWMDIAIWGGYYDQSHFIRNFKVFTGEEPSNYPFFEKNIANFFLAQK